MTTLTITDAGDNFYSGAPLVGIDAIVFNAPARALAHFRASQFNDVAISNSAHITGDTHANIITVIRLFDGPGTISAAGWTFTNWGPADDGRDSIYLEGSSGADTITGSSQEDIIQGWEGADAQFGGRGDDNFSYDPGDIVDGETVDGGPGNDRLSLLAGSHDFTFVSMSSIEALRINGGGGWTVTLTENQIGAAAIREVRGRNDPGDLPVHLFVGGSTTDLSGVAFDRWKSADTIELFGTSVLANDLTGSSKADKITAPGGSHDEMRGRGGKDVLVGGTGMDTLAGNHGKDKFVFDAPLVYMDFFGDMVLNRDHITDFEHGRDKIKLSQAVFTEIATGHLSADAFHRGALAADAEDRIIYHRSEGKLFFDPDGTGPSAQNEFAILDNHARLSHGELVVFA